MAPLLSILSTKIITTLHHEGHKEKKINALSGLCALCERIKKVIKDIAE